MATIPTKTKRHAVGRSIEYTPGSAVSAGDPIQIGSYLVGISPADIAASRKGSLDIDGLFLFRKATGALSRGDHIGWDSDGDPVDGTAGTGAATKTAASVNFWCGTVVKDAASGDATVLVALNAYGVLAATVLNDENDNEVLTVTATGSAVNHFNLANAATGNSPVIAAVGDDANIDLKLTPKGTGNVVTAAALLHQTSLIAPGFKASSADVAADALAIPVTAGVVKKTTGADAEALTLANGTAGQVLVIVLDTDGGGDGTLTPTTSYGFATIVFADAGDHATLMYVDDTLGWVILGLSGVAAPPAITV